MAAEGAASRFWRRGVVRNAARASDSYGLLLLLLLVDYALMALVDSGSWFGLIVAVPMSLTLVLAMHTSHSGRFGLRLAWIVAGIASAAGLGNALASTDQTNAALVLLLSCLLAVTPFVILRRILRHSEVSVETIFGAICVYIVIGIFFGMLFLGISSLGPILYGTPVPAAHQFLAQPGPHQPSDYLYLSFVTLTTVGFGDLTPLSNFARMVVVLDALIGQIFLVTLVARLVALYGRPPSSAMVDTSVPVPPPVPVPASTPDDTPGDTTADPGAPESPG
jgi:voltage-gated potassium channel